MAKSGEPASYVSISVRLWEYGFAMFTWAPLTKNFSRQLLAGSCPSTRSTDLFQNGLILRTFRGCEYFQSSFTKWGHHSLSARRILDHNQISGSFPVWLNLKSLQYMWVHYKPLRVLLRTEDMRAMDTLEVTYQLKTETLSITRSVEVSLNGQIWRTCSTCEYLYPFFGLDAHHWEYHSSIAFRFLGFNQLSGAIPAWSNLTSLQSMYVLDPLSFGRHEGPKFGSVASLRHRSSTDCRSLDSNQISGSLPEWYNLTSLVFMWVLTVHSKSEEYVTSLIDCS